ncbi:thermonuclease family protein [Candidatus Roizmanbacteria bacterium]|nr:thermonuclease family protein [Candidatus Roizmanbacteria bacterium]
MKPLQSGQLRFSSILRVSLYLTLLALLFSSPASSSDNNFTGQCIDVADGDTITVLTQTNEKIKIRLGGIDCPESFQVHGEKSKQFLSSLVFDKRVRIVPETIDQYGRTVAMVLVNGANINEQIVAQGHGWVFKKYCTAAHCNDWLKLEATARDARIGLWEDENPIPPWEWRTQQKSMHNSTGGLASKDPSPAAGASSSITTPIASTGGSSAVYHGNRRSQVFHGPSCKDYNCKNCTVVLGSIQEAVRSGYRAHRECVRE